MIQIIRIELLSFLEGTKALISQIAERTNLKRKSIRLRLQAERIEQGLNRAYSKMGQKGLEDYQRSNETLPPEFNPDTYESEIRDIQKYSEQYSSCLQELSNLQKRGLREALAYCTEEFKRTGWDLTEIAIPETLSNPGLRFKDVPFKEDILFLMARKKGNLKLIDGDTLIEPGDVIITIGTPELMGKFKRFLPTV